MSTALNGDTPPRGMGSGIGRLRAHLTLLAQADPEAIRTEVIARGRQPFIDGIIDTLGETGKYCYSCHRHGKERWAFRLYAELAKLVGSAPEITMQIMTLVGASLPVAKSSVESIDRARSLSPRQRLEMHARALREAGWTVEPPADWSEAVEVNGNGGPHV